MLHFHRLGILRAHQIYLQQKIGSDTLFLVGGCVRDLLLGLIDDPKDIDLTMAGDPKKIYTHIDKKDLSHFMTEKFGTITLIPKDPKIKGVQYELTPLRTEGKYDDYRHPEEIQWSDNILDDAKRRDFTINCVYYFSTAMTPLLTKSLSNKASREYTDAAFVKQLSNDGIVYDMTSNTIIVQKHELIAQFFVQGKFDAHAFVAYSDFIKEGFVSVIPTEVEGSQTTTKRFLDSTSLRSKGQTLQFIIDPYLGIQDMINRKLKAVGNPDDRFNEDALRIIRAVRFVNVVNEKLINPMSFGTEGNEVKNLGDTKLDCHASGSQGHNECSQGQEKIKTFDFDTMTWISLKKNFFLLQFVAKERVKEEICKAFRDGNPFGFIALLDELHLLKFLFPALYANKHIDQPVRYHPFDVYTHTLLAVKELQAINSDYLVRFGMLYHDVGKVDQYYMHELPLDREEVRKIFGTWLNHHTSGIDHVKKDFGALGFSNKEIDTIAWYVQNHSKPGEVLMASPDKRAKKLRDMLSEAGYKKVKNVLDITIGDRRGQMNPLQNSSDISDVLLLKELLDKLNTEEGQFTIKDMKINGTDLMKALKLKAGPKLGELLDAAFVWVRDDIKKRNSKKEIVNYVKKLLAAGS